MVDRDDPATWGPWFAQRVSLRGPRIVRGGSGEIARLSVNDPAVAALIAAAPDLYDALSVLSRTQLLRQAVDLLDDDGRPDDDRARRIRFAELRMRNALARVAGDR